MDMDWVQVVSQVGFPIAVAGYCLLVLNKNIQQTNKLLAKLETLIAGRMGQ